MTQSAGAPQYFPRFKETIGHYHAETFTYNKETHLNFSKMFKK
jgi:hypothetical protein